MNKNKSYFGYITMKIQLLLNTHTSWVGKERDSKKKIHFFFFHFHIQNSYNGTFEMNGHQCDRMKLKRNTKIETHPNSYTRILSMHTHVCTFAYTKRYINNNTIRNWNETRKNRKKKTKKKWSWRLIHGIHKNHKEWINVSHNIQRPENTPIQSAT